MNFYRDIFKKAWLITWKNKYLWFFGLFAVLLGNGGEYDFLFNFLGVNNDGGVSSGLGGLAQTGILSRQILPNLARAFVNDPVTFLIIIIVFFVIAVLICFLVWLIVVSQTALINNTAKIIGGKDSSFKEGIEVGVKKFWPVLGMNIVQKVLIYLFIFILGLSLFYGSLGTSIFYQILFFIFLLISLAISFLIKYSLAFLIIKDRNFRDSITEGWLLLKRNWLITLEIAVLIIAISFLVIVASALVLFTLSTPVLFIAMLFLKLQSTIGFWVIASIGFILVAALLMLVGAILATFQTAVWVNLYVELISGGGTSKILRLFSKA